MSENQTPGAAPGAKKTAPRRADLPSTDAAAASAAVANYDDAEPAFEWMAEDAGSASGASALEEEIHIKTDMDGDGPREPMRPARSLHPRLASDPATTTAGSDSDSGSDAGGDGTGREPSAVFNEPLPTSLLQIRPPQEEIDARSAERDSAAAARPVLPRVVQVLLAVLYPVVLLVAAIRLVTTPLFLWAEYHRPGFPADSFGFTTDDRMTYGSYAMDYLVNLAGPRFLGDLVNPGGKPLFAAGEVSHMADVKSVISMAFIVGAVLAVGMVIAIVYLLRRSSGGVRRGLFAGSLATLVLVIALGVLAFLGWDTFFTEFHQIFFKQGTWTFYLDDTLIRLFPGQFWMDAGMVIGAVVLVVSSLTLAMTWPTRNRRDASSRSSRAGRRAAATAA
ncbi:TIGR01906 family membrane protein [Arthrobacter sp. 35W]|uniref:TIGR01906 family membrane protein n=1 Tax=Arthrobacter sp. 35W TaxID=1132441 RepID=UPI000404466B|nr:TIGR01906 family membrane protein [Arthrobacter sp. 35W]